MSSKEQGLNNNTPENTKVLNAQSKSDVAARSESSAILKHQTEIDGRQQDSQETDDVYADTREVDETLPPGGKNVGDLNVNDLSKEGNKQSY